jgi:hypothetical protein
MSSVYVVQLHISVNNIKILGIIQRFFGEFMSLTTVTRIYVADYSNTYLGIYANARYFCPIVAKFGAL